MVEHVRVAILPFYSVDRRGRAELFLRNLDTGEIKAIKHLDKLARLFVTEAQMEAMFRRVAMEYNWQHPARKVSWRRLNRNLRGVAIFRLIGGQWHA